LFQVQIKRRHSRRQGGIGRFHFWYRCNDNNLRLNHLPLVGNGLTGRYGGYGTVDYLFISWLALSGPASDILDNWQARPVIIIITMNKSTG
jgi:hypothetical protein